MHDRLDAGAAHLRRRVHVRDEPEDGHVALAGRRRDGRRHVPVLVHPGVVQPERLELGDQVAEQDELPGRAWVSVCPFAGLGVVPDVPEEPVEDRSGHNGCASCPSAPLLTLWRTRRSSVAQDRDLSVMPAFLVVPVTVSTIPVCRTTRGGDNGSPRRRLPGGTPLAEQRRDSLGSRRTLAGARTRQHRRMLFMYLKHVITAGILSAALAIGPGPRSRRPAGPPLAPPARARRAAAPRQHQLPELPGVALGHHDIIDNSSAQQQSGSGGSGADQEAVRQHLTAAREALAELTKLPAASQLQGEQRQQVAQFISDFNAFATATTDWRPKYDTIDRELDQILGVDAAGSASGAASGSAPAAGASGSQRVDEHDGGCVDRGADRLVWRGRHGGSAAGGALDPTIVAKLREVRTHLDGSRRRAATPRSSSRRSRRFSTRRLVRARPAARSARPGRPQRVGGRVGDADRRAGAGAAASARDDQGGGEAVEHRRRAAGGGRLAGSLQPVGHQRP